MANEQNNFENDDISRLLGSLKSVEAPGDFDVRVRAKISQGRPSDRRGWITVQVAAAMLVVLAVGYFGFRSFSPRTDPSQHVQVASQQDAPPQSASEQAPRQPLPGSVYVPDEQPVHDTVATASKPSRVNPRMIDKTVAARQAKPERKQDGGGSVDMSSTISKPLSAIGAETTQSGKAWTVGEVKQNSVADRSGVKSGDVVIKIVPGKFVRVRRDGKIVEIPLKP